MSLAFDVDAERAGRRPALPRAPDAAFTRRSPTRAATPSPMASQVRADRRRVARRDEQAVAAWLRELSARTR